MLPKKIVFVDIETTGGRVNYDRIIEIGMLRVEDNKLVDTYHTLINPQTYLSPFIENLTGIGKDALTTAPTFFEVKDRILEMLEDCVFVAHNVRFDYGFLRNELKRNGSEYHSKHFCTVRLSRLLFPQFTRHNLDCIIERFNIPCESRHRAFDDAKVLWEFYQKVQIQFEESTFIQAVTTALKKPSVPTSVPVEDLEALPECPGVYIFYGENRTPLYIGKSINIRDRVHSHFMADHTTSRQMEMCQEIRNIETIPTSGELGALIKEAYLVKTMQPLYNRKLRYSRKMTILRKTLTREGYFTVTIEEIPQISPTDIDSIMGVFRSRKQVKDYLVNLVKEHNLCEKVLGIYKGAGVCFANHLGWCKGACSKKESPIRYNMRFTLAFSKNKLKPWPFNGPIRIAEENPLDGSRESIVVDKWCYLGSMKENEAGALDNLTNDYIFDLDTYKIIASYLRTSKKSEHIHELKSSDLASFSASL
jgi:DNA polymerase III subunit epsilon